MRPQAPTRGPAERSAAMTESMKTKRSDDHSPYANTSPMLAVGFLALLFVLVLKVMGG
jgi:hypothetical protein